MNWTLSKAYKLVLHCYARSVFVISDKLNKIRLSDANGDFHFIYKEYCLSDWILEDKELGEKEAKKASRSDATKPLLLKHV